MNSKDSKTMVVASRLASLGAIWIATKALETRKGQKLSERADARLTALTTDAEKKARRVRKNVSKNGKLAAAGLAAIAVGSALIARAATH